MTVTTDRHYNNKVMKLNADFEYNSHEESSQENGAANGTALRTA